jgi:hypothetical protein
VLVSLFIVFFSSSQKKIQHFLCDYTSWLHICWLVCVIIISMYIVWWVTRLRCIYWYLAEHQNILNKFWSERDSDSEGEKKRVGECQHKYVCVSLTMDRFENQYIYSTFTSANKICSFSVFHFFPKISKETATGCCTYWFICCRSRNNPTYCRPSWFFLKNRRKNNDEFFYRFFFRGKNHNAHIQQSAYIRVLGTSDPKQPFNLWQRVLPVYFWMNNLIRKRNETGACAESHLRKQCTFISEIFIVFLLFPLLSGISYEHSNWMDFYIVCVKILFWKRIKLVYNVVSIES